MNGINNVHTNILRTYAANASATHQAELKEKIRQVVGQVFFGTLLKQMRSEMDLSNPLNAGRAGQTFASQLDQFLLERLGKSKQFAPAEKIAQSWTGIK